MRRFDLSEGAADGGNNEPKTSAFSPSDFKYLSQNGNSNCSRSFMESIATMSPDAQLQGSCCGAMSEHRYREQLAGLSKYASIMLIPANPYDVRAGVAQQAMAWFAVQLVGGEQSAYDVAMANSAEQGLAAASAGVGTSTALSENTLSASTPSAAARSPRFGTCRMVAAGMSISTDALAKPTRFGW